MSWPDWTTLDWTSKFGYPLSLDVIAEIGGASERKLRLFALACIEHVAGREFLAGQEEWLEGQGQVHPVPAVLEALQGWKRQEAELLVPLLRLSGMELGRAVAGRCIQWEVENRFHHSLQRYGNSSSTWDIADAAHFSVGVFQGELLGDLFAHLLLPASVHPAWLAWNDAVVPKIAQRIEEEGDFDLLPILADALEDAGCAHSDILRHCREPAHHIRGCWVVDLLLGQS